MGLLVSACAQPRVQSPEEFEGDAAKRAPVKPFCQQPFLLGAHRGGAHLVPESTVAGFKETAARWPGILLETDAALTADGHVVLLHDETVDRTTNGRGPVAEMTLAEVKALDAGYWLSLDGGATYPYRGRGIKIATLEEALEALPEERFLVELKPFPGIADAAIPVIQRAGAEDRVLLASFAPDLMARARELAPNIAVCYDYKNGFRLLAALRLWGWSAYRPQADVLSLMRDMVSRYRLSDADIRIIREKGILVQVHTVNDPDEMRYWLDRGVDSILTDRPDLLANVIAEWEATREQPGLQRAGLSRGDARHATAR